jgi:hypothetical protein
MIKLTVQILFACFASALLFTRCMYSDKYCQQSLEKAMQQGYDLVIVPGAPLSDLKLNRILKARIYWSKFLYDNGIAKNIMYSGSAVYSPYIESEVMAMYAEAIGIPKEHIYTETKAEHSTENIYYSYKKAKLMGFERIALASDPVQSKLLNRFMRTRVSKDLSIVPIVFDTIKAMEPNMIDPVIDTQKALVKDFVALPQRESWWRRLRGTLGKNINKTYYSNASASQ